MKQPIELCLCEQNTLLLRPDAMYIFKTDFDCPKCVAIHRVHFPEKAAIEDLKDETKRQRDLAEYWERRHDNLWKETQNLIRGLQRNEEESELLHGGAKDGAQSKVCGIDENQVFKDKVRPFAKELLNNKPSSSASLGSKVGGGDRIRNDEVPEETPCEQQERNR